MILTREIYNGGKMRKLNSRILLAAVFFLLMSSAASLYAGAGCSKAGSYYTINLPDGWRVQSSGG